ncbi:XRE family transcriptional regulator [Rummeliibacillus sp. TYF005]|uniref:helix-turn-helix domain-containing protein n=1 Tax=Rummeliibacillus sp. TYF005 TaxID=2058214 RepID=UPI000F53BF51|nr:helix-turn-helix transcriptional regulator [Rummeliibacillus sp. TYF005]RPJ97228.1 XRE family transcriptional regulator [Rummeliibacillus sp. TYF005]
MATDIIFEKEYYKIGQVIKNIRISNQLSQEDFSNSIGISLSHLSKLEAPGSCQKVSLDVLLCISKKYNIPMKNFFD